jgi:hypothetical protein
VKCDGLGEWGFQVGKELTKSWIWMENLLDKFQDWHFRPCIVFFKVRRTSLGLIELYLALWTWRNVSYFNSTRKLGNKSLIEKLLVILRGLRKTRSSGIIGRQYFLLQIRVLSECFKKCETTMLCCILVRKLCNVIDYPELEDNMTQFYRKNLKLNWLLIFMSFCYPNQRL